MRAATKARLTKLQAYPLAGAIAMALALLPISTNAMKGVQLPTAQTIVKKAKLGVKELIYRKADHASENERHLRHFERILSHAMLPVLGRMMEVLPPGFSNDDLTMLGYCAAVSTIGGLGGDWLFRGLDLLNTERWKRFSRGSPIASFIRGAYGSIGISAIGLGIVLPAISGGFQLDPVVAAEIVAGTSLTSGTLRAIGKVIGNRKLAEEQWFYDATEAAGKQ